MLVSSVADSDADIFRRIYPQLRAIAAAVADQSDVADDLVQEALVRVLRNGSLSDLDNPKAYLRATIVSVSRDRHRARQTKFRAFWRLGPSRSTILPWYPSDLSALDRLAPLDRSILYLNIVEQWTFEEIAELLGIRPSTVRKRSSRAKSRLRAAGTE